ncbi:hypothetical protein ACN47E_000955 [Coniothyrium glycines]
MSGLEVVAAVAAVVSAFHGGSELLKIVKEKRRTRKARDQAQQEWEETQLQDSLVTGEQQIRLRWAQDIQELGEYMRVGDVIARDRLIHVVITLQAELIKSLELAAIHGTAILNLRLLHHASMTSKTETFATFDELKYRLYFSKRIPTPLHADLPRLDHRQSTSTVQTVQSNNYNPSTSGLDNYPQAATPMSPLSQSPAPKHTLTEYFRSQRSKSAPSVPPHVQPPDMHFSAALQEFIKTRGQEDPAATIQHIQDMLSTMNVSESKDPSGIMHPGGAHLERHDTLTMLSGGESHHNVTTYFDRNGMPYSEHSPSSTNYHPHNHDRGGLTLSRNMHESHLGDSAHHPQGRFEHYTYSQPPNLSNHRWSDMSAPGSPYSEATSLNRNSSNSSQDSNVLMSPTTELPRQYDPSRLSSITMLSHNDDHEQPQGLRSRAPDANNFPIPVTPSSPQHLVSESQAYSTFPASQHGTSASPISPHDKMASPKHMPWPGSEREPFMYVPNALPRKYPEPTKEYGEAVPKPSHLQQSLATHTLSSPSERTITPSGFEAIATAANSLTNGANMRVLRHTSLTPSVASTDSSGSGSIGILPGSRMRPRSSIRIDTIKSGPAGQERMMDGRPDKHNNYWGFCKGAWAVREDTNKGIVVRTQPSGMYNTKQVWECKECAFQGDIFTAPHPSKKHKTVQIVDPRIHVSMAGVRYRWIFLAKSHVKKRHEASTTRDECNYGCVFCSVEGNVTGVYGGVETLMSHIAQTHAADMSDRTRKMTNCVLGRVAVASEQFDVNMPIFAQIEELAA